MTSSTLTHVVSHMRSEHLVSVTVCHYFSQLENWSRSFLIGCLVSSQAANMIIGYQGSREALGE